MGCNAVANAIEDDRPPLDVTLTDRRRPGQRDYQNAHLIALLRGQARIISEGEGRSEAQSADDVAPARAVVIGVSIGGAMWATIIMAVWYLL
jgi:hypothetical protein